MAYFCGFNQCTTLGEIREKFLAELVVLKTTGQTGMIINYINQVRAIHSYKGACDNFFISILGSDHVNHYWEALKVRPKTVSTPRAHAQRAAYLGGTEPAKGNDPDFVNLEDLDRCFVERLTLDEVEDFFTDPAKCKIMSSHESFAGEEIEYKPAWRERLLKILKGDVK